MLLRAVLAFGGVTFLVSGVGIMLNESCRSVVWGRSGSDRAGNFTATCRDIAFDGSMSQAGAGLLSIVVGIALVAGVTAPYLRDRLVLGKSKH